MSTRTLSGSCLCGSVSYTVEGEEHRFYHCHCTRCRKASGTGHASNLFVKGALTWNSGEDLANTFKLPEAERFSNTFCRQCGGRVPRFVEEFGIVFIPAGSLDDEPTMRPQARIFLGSRADWSCDTSEISGFSEYPE
ncbi:MAG: aldehyde-activating protein [Xanthomonadales bacterium]|nr:GFA family protein [Xanthomonadales bacterium]NIX13416.1 aldehyde-activating protein [Xanthomonadales bacterium]